MSNNFLDWGNQPYMGNALPQYLTGSSMPDWYTQVPNMSTSSLGMMNPASNNFIQPGGIAPQGSWWTQTADWFKGTKLGAGLSDMGQSMGGWGNALGGLNALFSMYSGIKAWDERKDYLKLAKREARDNRQIANNAIEDQWISRNANAQASGRDFEAKDSWMKRRALMRNQV